MADSKTYLNVPFAQKDEAKALGARWDAIKKKWFVPADKDITLFAKWQAGAAIIEPSKSKTSSVNNHSSTITPAVGAKTYATIKDFVAYKGDAPPWN